MVEFVQFPVVICTGHDSDCGRRPVRVVLVDGLWDGNGVCDSEECAAAAIAEFDRGSASPWGDPLLADNPDWPQPADPFAGLPEPGRATCDRDWRV